MLGFKKKETELEDQLPTVSVESVTYISNDVAILNMQKDSEAWSLVGEPVAGEWDLKKVFPMASEISLDHVEFTSSVPWKARVLFRPNEPEEWSVLTVLFVGEERQPLETWTPPATLGKLPPGWLRVEMTNMRRESCVASMYATIVLLNGASRT